MCEGGLDKQQSAKQHNCPLLPPQGLRVTIKGQMLAVAPGDDITFIVHQEQVGRKLLSCRFFFSICFKPAESPRSFLKGWHQQHQVPGRPWRWGSGHLPEPDGDRWAHPASLWKSRRLQSHSEGWEYGGARRGHHVHPGHRSASHTVTVLHD